MSAFSYDHDSFHPLHYFRYPGPWHLGDLKSVAVTDSIRVIVCRTARIVPMRDLGPSPSQSSIFHHHEARLFSLTGTYNKNACIFAILH